MASGSRILLVLSRDRLFPKSVARIDRKGRSPYVAILIMSVASFFLSFFDFEILVQMELVYLLAQYILVSFIVIKLRKRFPVESRNKDTDYIIKGGKLGLIYTTLLPIVISVVALLLSEPIFVVYSIISLFIGNLAFIILKYIYGGVRYDPKKLKSKHSIWNIFIRNLHGILIIMGSSFALLIIKVILEYL